MSLTVSAQTRGEITQMLSEFYYHLDHKHYTELWRYYTEDAVSITPMGTVSGRDTLKAGGERRAASGDTSVVRHFLGTMHLAHENGDTDQVNAVVYYTTFRDSSEVQHHPASMGEFSFVLRRVDGQWLIARNEVMPVFGAQNAAAHAARLNTTVGKQ